MYKNLGLTSEEVCEIGKWKNSQAFSNHYLRVGAPNIAATRLLRKFVHKISPERSAEPDWSRTPGTPRGTQEEGTKRAEHKVKVSPSHPSPIYFRKNGGRKGL